MLESCGQKSKRKYELEERIVPGGLVAGLIINRSQGSLQEGVLNGTWSTSMQALGMTGESCGGRIAMDLRPLSALITVIIWAWQK